MEGILVSKILHNFICRSCEIKKTKLMNKQNKKQIDIRNKLGGYQKGERLKGGQNR